MFSVISLWVLCGLFASSIQQENSSPKFESDLSTLLVEQGISEDFPVDSPLGFIVCSDNDTDDLIRYRVTKSQSLSVDAITGQVFLDRPLDREAIANSNDNKLNSVTFGCIDYNRQGEQLSPKWTTVDLVITVKDSNDQLPTFATANGTEGYTFHIAESAGVDTLLSGGIILVTDEDKGNNAKLDSLDFFCKPNDQDPCRLFKINYTMITEGNYTAKIYLNGPLDFETRNNYITSIVAVDSPGQLPQNTASVGLRILVDDKQDTDPIFTNRNLNFIVQEGLAAGTIVNFNVSARDGDSGAKRKVKLEVLPDANNLDLFRLGPEVLVDSDQGVYQSSLIINSDIDRESLITGNTYSFTTKVTELEADGSLTTATATKVFTCIIQDVNDNSPKFLQAQYNVSMAEMGLRTSAVQIPNLSIIVNDLDEPTNSQYRLRIERQDFPGAFGFTPDSQVSGLQYFYLTVNKFEYMDYEVEAYRVQTVVLRAVEILENGQEGPRSDRTTVTVSLTNINDNSPIFDRPDYGGSIVENAANFTSILTINAKDRDSGPSGDVYYSLPVEFENLFYMEPTTGVIRLMGLLDFESVSEYSFVALAMDRGNPARTSQTLVRILVTNFNDIGPQFTLDKYTAEVTESKKTFESPVQVTAKDPADPNANITYRIVSGNTATDSFVLDPFTGVLSLKETVNFLQTPGQKGIFSLVIEASDNDIPPEKAQSIITVTVIDENNHAPVFDPRDYSKTISEEIAKGTFVLQVYATDDDFGSNGEIYYRIGSGGRDNFVVDTDGKVYISNNPSFDFDDYTKLRVEIIARDDGSPQQSDKVFMDITITDYNNKPPRFASQLYTAIVNDTAPIGFEVLQLVATDPDTNYKLQYSIIRSSFIAINKAGAQLISTYPYDFREAFRVDPVNGQLIVNSALKREYVVEVSFEVMVTDIYPERVGFQNDTTRVRITLRGQPNIDLYFNKPWTKELPVYTILIPEGSPIGTTILTLQARDPADGGSVIKRYEEVPNTDLGNFFTIDADSGKLRLNRELDYEEGDRTHSVVIRALKVGDVGGVFLTRSATATVIIRVTDVNDNLPEFVQTSYEFRLDENTPANTEVGVITARDLDSASFGPIRFFMGSVIGSEDFYLYQPEDDGSVQLMVRNPPDYEKTPQYVLDVIASDNEQDRSGAQAIVTINIVDLNDNTPKFSQKDAYRTFTVMETAELQYQLGQILATDADRGSNGDIRYSLKADMASQRKDQALRLFTVTEQSGVIKTQALLGGLTGNYSLFVVASDRGVPSLTSSIPITIKVQESQDDDGRPKWFSPINNYVVRVTEHNKTRLDVQVSALARSSPNPAVTYSLARLSTDFRIDRDTGDIYVTGDLDYEVQPVYTLVLQAQDTVDPSMISSRTLTVQLIDIDDNTASFKKSRYNACPTDFEVPTVFSVMDKTQRGVMVAQAQACDPDGPNNNRIDYYLYTGTDTGSTICRDNNSGAFKVHLNGSVETTRRIVYEVQTEYLVCVQLKPPTSTTGRKRRAFDVNEMKESDRIGYIVIRVIDINDNGPVFPLDHVTAVLATVPTESIVVQVEAKDIDSPQNGRVRYIIQDTMYYPPQGGRPISMRGAFAINPDTGVISANLPSYEDFARGYFTLTVVAFDLDNQSFNDNMTVTVVIYQRSQLLRVVLNRDPSEGLLVADNLIEGLNQLGRPNKEFIYVAASEHRTASHVVATQTDICFVLVENNQATEVQNGIAVLDRVEYRNLLQDQDFKMIDRGTCYPLRSTEKNVKWRDLWWVLVALAIFIFFAVVLLLVTVHILYDRYASYMDTHKTYLVPQ